MIHLFYESKRNKSTLFWLEGYWVNFSLIEIIVRRRNAEEHQYNTVADTVHLLPGLRFGANSRNAGMLNVRGFDSRKTPVYVDGIPPYVPYDAMWISTASPRLIWPKCAWPVRHLAAVWPQHAGRCSEFGDTQVRQIFGRQCAPGPDAR